MFRAQNKQIHKVAMFLDAVIVAGSFLAAFIMRDYIDMRFLHVIPSGLGIEAS